MALQTNDFEHQRLLPRTLEDLLIGWVSRLGGAALLAVCFGLWLAMLTWSASDPSFSSSNGNAPANLLGAFGASISDLLLQTIGLSSVFALSCLVVWGLQLLLAERVDRFQVRGFLALIAIIAIAAGFSALPTVESWSFHHGYGGIIGDIGFNLVAGLFAQFRISASAALAGLTVFVIGIWAFSCAIGLDRERIFQLISPARRNQERAARRKRKYRDMITETGDWLKEESGRLTSTIGQRIEPRFGLSNLRGRPKRDVVGRPDAAPFEHAAPVADRAYDDRGEPAAEPMPALLDDDGEDFAIAKRFAPGGAKAATVKADAPVPPQAMPDGGHELRHDADLPAFMAPRGKQSRPRYRKPSLNELQASQDGPVNGEPSQNALQATAEKLTNVLADFRVKGEIRNVRTGPVVTLFEFEPARGTKSSRVVALADDVARSMSAASARIAVIPGRNAIGIELPNEARETVTLRELLETDAYKRADAHLPLALGRGIGGEPVVADLARMPHLLVAGTTGSGKSVGINAMILSLLYRKTPADCRFLMIDPKMLELSVYNGIPHLLSPVITDPQQAVSALNWAVCEMEERYKRMAELGVRNIDAFNARVKHAKRAGEPLVQKVQTGFDPETGEACFEDRVLNLEPIAHIVIVVDEFADLMSVAGKEIEAAVQRLAQMARAAGMHLIMATQRPSVDVVTGTIKANFPTRIGFKVASKIDSRTILNEQGAEQLLGQGDMLLASGGSPMLRVHGPFVSDDEVEAVANALKSQCPPDYVDAIVESTEIASNAAQTGANALYERAVALVQKDGKVSTSYIQRRLSIGYNRAADLIERMERDGMISAASHTGKRQILIESEGATDRLL